MNIYSNLQQGDASWNNIRSVQHTRELEPKWVGQSLTHHETKKFTPYEGPVWVKSEDKTPRASNSDFEVEI